MASYPTGYEQAPSGTIFGDVEQFFADLEAGRHAASWEQQIAERTWDVPVAWTLTEPREPEILDDRTMRAWRL